MTDIRAWTVNICNHSLYMLQINKNFHHSHNINTYLLSDLIRAASVFLFNRVDSLDSPSKSPRDPAETGTKQMSDIIGMGSVVAQCLIWEWGVQWLSI